MNRLAPVLLLAAAVVAGCASDPAPQPAAARAVVAVASAGTGASAVSVELLTDTRLETGMTPVYLRVSAGGQPVTDADVSFEPMMAMSGGMSHSCPLAKPAAAADGLYHGYANFIMPTSAMGTWSATVGVTRPGQARVDVAFPSIVVFESGRSKSFQDFDPESQTTTKYFASIRFLSGPAVGLNTVALTLHRKDGMMFPPVSDAAVHWVPSMPSMGHGSTGNVDPVLATSGVYQGTLGFSMTGTWETRVTLSRPASGGTRQIGTDQVFTTTF